MVKKFFYRLFIFILLIVIGFCIYQIGKAFYKYYTAREGFTKVAEAANVDTDKFTGEINWDKLKEMNPDIVAWIYLKDSNINYPVVKGKDDEKYLTHAYDGSWSGAGTPFIDSRIENEFVDFNTIIYGHHMKDGSMFNNLSKFLRKEDYYKSHKQFELITPEEKYHLKVCSGFLTDAESDVYNLVYSEPDIYEHIEMIKKNNSIKGIDDHLITPLDSIVTLSTCAYEFKNARCVIIGKLSTWSDKEKEEALKIEELKKKEKKKKKSSSLNLTS